jgi:sigma-54 dependent transcriptional regulator, acetoin dehydrogenase operon transcriptional activator AcoR
MSESLLVSIKDSVLMYAQVISTILKMDVDIVDEQMIRVAGTDKFYMGVGKSIDNEGNAFREVLKTRETLIVENPGRDEVCLTCGSRFNCEEEYEICCPIVLGDKVLGAISLAAFDKETRADIVARQESYILFLEQISDLIAAKAVEHKRFEEQTFSLKLLNTLIDCVNDGVIVFSQSHQITHINKKTEQILGHNLQQMAYLKKINEFAVHKVKSYKSLNMVEYVARVRSKKVGLVGNIYPISIDGIEAGSVFVFQEVTILNRNSTQNQNLKHFSFDHIIGQEKHFVDIKESAKKLAYSDVNLLISGETGAGKEMFAKAIHNESSRRDKSFETVICSGSLESVLEKEIFGYGTETKEFDKLGKLQLAQGGTLFIDEVGDLTLRLQGKLMQVIQNKKDFDIRILAATSQDLKAKTESGEFRKDLYYSLIAFELLIPPVRSRSADVPVLVDYFLEKYCRIEGKRISLSDEVVKLMKNYIWPGNVREIEKIINFIVNSQDDGVLVEIDKLPSTVRSQLVELNGGQYNLDRIEKNTILQVLNIFGNTTESKKKAAKELGISIATLYRKLEKYGIEEQKQFL